MEIAKALFYAFPALLIFSPAYSFSFFDESTTQDIGYYWNATIDFLKAHYLLPKEPEKLVWDVYLSLFFVSYILLAFVFRLPKYLALILAVFLASIPYNILYLSGVVQGSDQHESSLNFVYLMTGLVLFYLLIDYILNFAMFLSYRTREILKITLTAYVAFFIRVRLMDFIDLLLREYIFNLSGLFTIFVIILVTRIFFTILGIMNTKMALRRRIAGAKMAAAARREVEKERKAIMEVLDRGW